jgi:hypothetical protein
MMAGNLRCHTVVERWKDNQRSEADAMVMCLSQVIIPDESPHTHSLVAERVQPCPALPLGLHAKKLLANRIDWQHEGEPEDDQQCPYGQGCSLKPLCDMTS